MEKITFSDAIIQMAIELAPTLVVVSVLFIVVSWLRLIVDSMTGKGW